MNSTYSRESSELQIHGFFLSIYVYRKTGHTCMYYVRAKLDVICKLDEHNCLTKNCVRQSSGKREARPTKSIQAHLSWTLKWACGTFDSTCVAIDNAKINVNQPFLMWIFFASMPHIQFEWFQWQPHEWPKSILCQLHEFMCCSNPPSSLPISFHSFRYTQSLHIFVIWERKKEKKAYAFLLFYRSSRFYRWHWQWSTGFWPIGAVCACVIQ